MISGMNMQKKVMNGCCMTALHQRRLRERERRAEHRDDDAEEHQPIGAAHERRALGARADLNCRCV